MSGDRQERIRKQAHAIWEREGRQHGLHEKHWHDATREIDAEDAATQASVGAGPALAKHSKDAAKPRRAGAKASGSDARANPKTSGAASKTATSMPDPFTARKSDAPRQAGATPRPTKKPTV